MQPISGENQVNFGEIFTTSFTVHAAIFTVRGDQIFDGTSQGKEITHKFVIRYIPTLTEEKWIYYRGDSYDIVDIEDYDERLLFMVLKATKRGDLTLPVNDA